MSIKFSQLPAGAAPTGAELMPVVQGGTNVTITPAQIQTYVRAILASIDRNLVPSADAIYSLGTAVDRFTTAYLSGDVDAGGNANITGQVFVGGVPVLNGGEVSYWAPLGAEGATVQAPQYYYGIPERYGAVGNGVANDTAALNACITGVGFINMTSGKTYLNSGLTITTTGVRIFTTGPNLATLLLSAAGTAALHFVSPAGNATHFNTGFIGKDFIISSNASAIQQHGIFADNAEIQYMENVLVEMQNNTFAGAVRAGSFGFYGFFQQDGVFCKCSFTGGSGAFGDGVFMFGNLSLNETPNNNLFLGCRAQGCGGYGVRNCLGNGNTWIGGKIQGNAGGGWIEATDGLGNGPGNTLLLGFGFEANDGYDLQVDVCNRTIVRAINFESAVGGTTGHINVAFGVNMIFRENSSPAGKSVTISGGSGNIWDRTNLGFGAKAFTAGTVIDRYIVDAVYSGSALAAIDASLTDHYQLVVTAGGAFSIPNPVNLAQGQTLSFEIVNSTGGSIGAITWGAAFKLVGAAWVNPANNFRRTITFIYNNQWVELSRSSGDI